MYKGAVFLFTIFLLLQTYCDGQMFSSSSMMEESVIAESNIIKSLKTYLDTEENRLKSLRRFILDKYNNNYRLLVDLKNKEVDIADPVSTFQLMKRMVKEWNEMIEFNRVHENLLDLKENISFEEHRLPQKDDRYGSLHAIIRLQDTYRLKAGDMAKGNLGKVKVQPMTVEACFSIGRGTYSYGLWDNALEWLQVALEKHRLAIDFEEEESFYSVEINILDYLSFTYYQIGNLDKAIGFAKEILQYEPENKRVIQNILSFEKENKDVTKQAEKAQERAKEAARKKEPSWYPRYLDLCRGNTTRTLEEVAKLTCYYDKSNIIRTLEPPKVEVFNREPRIIMFHDVISDKEAEDILNLTRPKLKRSRVVHPGTGETTFSNYRVSSGYFWNDGDAPILMKVNKRIEQISGLSCRFVNQWEMLSSLTTNSSIKQPHAEGLQVVNYGLGGVYEPHCDHAIPEDGEFQEDVHLPGSRNRLATWMFYLSEVEAGGYTVFPRAGAFVPPVKNSAVLWFNIKRSGDLDDRTWHGGCPVLYGTKWVANKWIHEYGQEFRHPCSLDKSE